MGMKAEDKAKWLEALRSGEYEQIDSTLCADGRYCCLGVLETILDGDVEKDEMGMPQSSPTCDFLNRHSIEVELRGLQQGKEWPTEFPLLDYKGVYNKLMEMNDELIAEYDAVYNEYTDNRVHANTFKDIADYIEQNVEVYE